MVYLDGLFLRVMGVQQEAVYVALGITPSGERQVDDPLRDAAASGGGRPVHQVLGFWLLPTESALAWEEVLKGLWQRGLRRVLLFVTDGLPGMEAAIQRVYPGTEWQRCVVHRVRSSLAQVRARDRGAVAEHLRGVYRAESRQEALEGLERLRRTWGSRYPRLVSGLSGAAAVL